MKERPVRLPQIDFPESLVQLAVHASNRADEEKLQAGLHKLHDEDPTFQMHFNPETHETIVSGLGERHLEVTLSKLRRKFGVTAELTRPRIAYRETLKARGDGQGRHKKQSGGRGQFGDCWVRFAPLARGKGYEFDDQIVGGSIPRGFIPAVDRGIQEAAVRGIVAGFPLVDFKVELYDGSYHTVDSNEMSFKMAGILAFKAVAPKCRPVLLEPLDEIDVLAPDDHMGDVLGDLSSRRGHILGTDIVEDTSGASTGYTRIRAVVPEAELHLYGSSLQSMTQGRATYTRKFKGYEEAPHDVAQKVVAEHGKQRDEELVGA